MEMSRNRKWIIYGVWPFWWGSLRASVFHRSTSNSGTGTFSRIRSPSLRMGGDYREALAAMMTFMVRDLGLPQVVGVVWFYPTRSAFESALAADYLNDLNQIEKQFGPKGKAVSSRVLMPERRKRQHHSSRSGNTGECSSTNGTS